MNEVAREFLIRCFAPGSTIAFLLRTGNPAKTQQHVVTLEQAVAPRYLGWLTHENSNGANVYVAANPLRSGSRRRTKENIDCVNHLYLDIDEDGDARLASLWRSDSVPSASVILSTSPGKYQVLWRVVGFDSAQQETTFKQLTFAFGGDPACTDCNRVLRIPGFLNYKYSPACSVGVEYGSDQPSDPSDFRPLNTPETFTTSLHEVARYVRCHKDTRSEQDWAWACSELAKGKDAGKLTHELASRRSDKPNPLYYAQRTVDVASARQLLLNNAPIGDVIIMLQDRRRLEFPASLCCARAREIATTARRMVARRKTA